MVAGIFGLVKEWRDFLFCVSEDVKRRDFWGSILKACSEVVWGLGVGVESKIPFLRYFFLNVIYAISFLMQFTPLFFRGYYYIFDVSC